MAERGDTGADGEPDRPIEPTGAAGGDAANAEPSPAGANRTSTPRDDTTEVPTTDRTDGAAEPTASESRARLRARLRARERRRLAALAARVTAVRDQRVAELRAAQDAPAIDPLLPDTADDPDRLSWRPFRTGFIGAIGVILAYISYLAVQSIRDTLIIIAIAAVIAIGLEPAVQMLIRRGFGRAWSVTVVFLALLAVIAGAIYAIIPPIINELVQFAQSIPQLIENLQNNPTIKEFDARFGVIEQIQNSDALQTIGGGAAGGLLTAGVAAAGIVFDLLVILILALFFLAGLPRIKDGAYRLAPASRRTRVRELGDKILKQMGGYLSGAAVVAAQAGIVAGVFSAIVGLPYPWAIALGAAILDFVPVIGPVIIGVSMTLLGFTQSLLIGIIAGLFYLCQHMFEAYWLYPVVMRRQVDISTATVVVAIIIGGALLGVTGALLAVPVAAAVQLIIREVVVPMQDRS